MPSCLLRQITSLGCGSDGVSCLEGAAWPVSADAPIAAAPTPAAVPLRNSRRSSGWSCSGMDELLVCADSALRCTPVPRSSLGQASEYTHGLDILTSRKFAARRQRGA